MKEAEKMKKTTLFVSTMVVAMCIYGMFLLKNDIPNEVQIQDLQTHHYELPFETPEASPWWNMIAFPLGITLYFLLFNFEAVTGKESNGLNSMIRVKYALKMTLYAVRIISLMFFELTLFIGALTVFICNEVGPGGGILSAIAVSINMFLFLYFLGGPLVFSFMSLIDGYDYDKTLTGNYMNQIIILSKEGLIKMIPFMIGATIVYCFVFLISNVWKIFGSLKRLKISFK